MHKLLKRHAYPVFKLGYEATAFESHLKRALESEYERQIRIQLEGKERTRLRGQNLALMMQRRRSKDIEE